MIRRLFFLLSSLLFLSACDTFRPADIKNPLLGKWRVSHRSYFFTVDKQVVNDTSIYYTTGTFYREFTEKTVITTTVVNLQPRSFTDFYRYQDSVLITYPDANATVVDSFTFVVSNGRRTLAITKSNKETINGEEHFEKEVFYLTKN